MQGMPTVGYYLLVPKLHYICNLVGATIIFLVTPFSQGGLAGLHKGLGSRNFGVQNTPYLILLSSSRLDPSLKIGPGVILKSLNINVAHDKYMTH